MIDPTRIANRNRPTIGALAAAFVAELAAWGSGAAIAAGIPETIVTSGAALLVAGAAFAIGQIVQRYGDHAPWADETHRAAVAYALTLDPADHPEARAAILRRLGLADDHEVAELVGMLPHGED